MATKTQPVFLLGLGGVGRALLSQIMAARDLHRGRNGLKFAVLGMADSAGMLHGARGLTDVALQKALDAKQRTGRLPEAGLTHASMLALINTLPANTIVVDTSATDLTVPALLKAKKRGLGVVLANKRPVAGDLAWWDAIADNRSRWETTCGAALPVISTLNTLLDNGDTVHRIEGTLSGTLGFISAQLEAGIKFGKFVFRDFVDVAGEGFGRDMRKIFSRAIERIGDSRIFPPLLLQHCHHVERNIEPDHGRLIEIGHGTSHSSPHCRSIGPNQLCEIPDRLPFDLFGGNHRERIRRAISDNDPPFTIEEQPAPGHDGYYAHPI